MHASYRVESFIFYSAQNFAPGFSALQSASGKPVDWTFMRELAVHMAISRALSGIDREFEFFTNFFSILKI